MRCRTRKEQNFKTLGIRKSGYQVCNWGNELFVLKKSWTVGTLNVTDVLELNICKQLQWWILCSFSDQNLLPSKPKNSVIKTKTIPFNPRWLLSKGKMDWRHRSPAESACCPCWIPELVPSTCNSSSRDPTPSSSLCRCPCTHTHKDGHKSVLENAHILQTAQKLPCEISCVGQCWFQGPREPRALKDGCVTTLGRYEAGLGGKAPWMDKASGLFLCSLCMITEVSSSSRVVSAPASPVSVFPPEIFSRPEQGLGNLQTPTLSFRKYQNCISSSHIL